MGDVSKLRKLKMKIFQLALIASSAAFEEKSSKKRCEQDVMEEDMEYCEDHNTSLTGCVDWIKEDLEYMCDGDKYSCILTRASSYATWRTWEAGSDAYGKLICMRARDVAVNKSELQRGCENANKMCNGDVNCIRDHLVLVTMIRVEITYILTVRKIKLISLLLTVRILTIPMVASLLTLAELMIALHTVLMKISK